MTTPYPPPHTDDEPADPTADLIYAVEVYLAIMDAPPDSLGSYERNKRVGRATADLRRAAARHRESREGAAR